MDITRKGIACLMAAAVTGLATAAAAQEFDWKAHSGETVTFLANSNPLGQLLIDHADEFKELTGINLVIDSYQEQQMRQRLMTVMNARSDEVDVFMTLPSREGMQFAAAGWYADLTPYIQNNVSPDYNADGLGKALLEAATFDGKLTGVPLNIEGPLLYYRTDIFEECGVEVPSSLEGLSDTAAKLKECTDATPFASRGLAAAAPYTFSGFMHNMGGQYMVDGKSAMCSREAKQALSLYSDLLKNYGPPGVVNYSFQQLTALYRAGRSAMSFQSSNEFGAVMEGGDRMDDTAIVPLPEGPGGSHPTVIGWGLAISAHSANPDAAWYFLQWASSPEMQAKLALEGIAPPREAIAESAEYKAWLDESPVRKQWHEALAELAETGTSEIGYPIIANPESRQHVGQAIGDLLLGTVSVDEACATADAALNELIARD
ncbi:ABC transporter substrate-binding protein [Paracoccus alkanivorans]|uniref:Sugar ABC transporter substrate-binding protein n=1 Tax=Paracoccus alkanivorans TaxID=2116655 RepID=A0A3M0MXZ6_9RHOB|nr:sugar ABC transporter substrate-binding protein [Paracoccus alkanivorans]RMC36237.1 sugar ABC transporter substrate-binding protein [Paracoccus alkanivorans]